MIGAIASVPLPPADNSGSAIFDPLMGALRDRHGIEVPVFTWPAPPDRVLRISAHLYNDVQRITTGLPRRSLPNSVDSLCGLPISC